jgi:6-phosphogluconolactonase
LNQKSSRGAAPCHLSIDGSGRVLCVANYSGGSVVSLPIQSDGSLGEPSAFFQHEGSGPNPQRQGEPHAHSVTLDAQSRFALACDLGLDKILTYQIDAAQQKLSAPQVLEARSRPGSGPRHFAFHPQNSIRLQHQRVGFFRHRVAI